MTAGADPLPRAGAPERGGRHEGATSRPEGPGRRRGLDQRRRTFWALSLPATVVLLVFVVLPLLLVVAVSFRPDLRGPILGPFEPTLKQYAQFIDSAAYTRLLWISALVAFGTAAIATALAYPVAYFLTFRAGKRAGLYLILLLVPFWTSYLLRVMAWKLMLGENGVINGALVGTGLLDEPLDALLYNRNAVVVTLIYVWIPFATLPILAAMGRIDVRLHDAASDLYASGFQQFIRVTLPLSFPGIVAAFLMVFIPTVGEYVSPLLVGGSTGSLFGNIIQDFFVRAANWPLGSALSVVMLVVTLVLVVVGLRVVQPRRLLGT